MVCLKKAREAAFHHYSSSEETKIGNCDLNQTNFLSHTGCLWLGSRMRMCLKIDAKNTMLQ